MREYEIIDKKALERWLDDSRSNPKNFISGLLYEFGRAEHVVIDEMKNEIDALKAQLASAKENAVFYARFWSKVSVLRKNECWNWLSSISPNGYGKISRNNYPLSAHVESYKYFHSDYDKNLCIDHICMNRKCVNPHHLRQVSFRDNCVYNSNSVSAKNLSKEECKHGHKFTDGNTIKKLKNGNIHRLCRICRDLSSKESRARQKIQRMVG
jgi:hypothetical protein